MSDQEHARQELRDDFAAYRSTTANPMTFAAWLDDPTECDQELRHAAGWGAR